MNSAISGNWRVGRWQNLVTKGEMMRVMTDFRRMRFGLGVTLMTDSYFAMDIGGGWYGVPSYYTEYEAGLGQALADPVRVFSSGDADDDKEEVWTRQFEHGLVIVSSLTASNFTVKVDRRSDNTSSRAGGGGGLRPLPLSKNVNRISGQREAPAWQFIIDNDLQSTPTLHSHIDTVDSKQGQWERALESGAARAACVCSAAAPACCAHSTGTPSDWWAEDGRRAGFRIVAGKWTTVTDAAESHQVRRRLDASCLLSLPAY
eukprot:SAG22_NODE_979_length_6186_cov_10.777887_5_plen_260_part_00